MNAFELAHAFTAQWEVGLTEHSAELMHRIFWQPLGCDTLPDPISVTLYDCAVQVGNAQAVIIMQQCLNTVGEAHLDNFIPLSMDGICGPLTIGMARAIEGAGLDFYSARMCVRQRRDFYVRICRQKTTLAPFLHDWKNRCASLLEYIAKMEKRS